MFNKLKPCPFCGGNAVFRLPYATMGDDEGCSDTIFIICTSCYVSTVSFRIEDWDQRSESFKETKKKAIDAWNTRISC